MKGTHKKIPLLRVLGCYPRRWNAGVDLESWGVSGTEDYRSIISNPEGVYSDPSLFVRQVMSPEDTWGVPETR